MFLEIPSKLEQYIDDIKKQMKYINPENKIVLLRVGSSIQNENRKIMYLIYNPFAIDINIDCNFFTNDSEIFKLYPSEFKLRPNTAHAFIAFTSKKEGNVEVDEQQYIMHLRNNIFKKLSKLNNIETYSGYKSTHIFNIESHEYNSDETIYLNEHQNEMMEKLTTSKFDTKKLNIKIDNLEKIDDNYNVVLSITNNDETKNFKSNGYNLKFIDHENIALISIKSELILKSMSKKKFKISFPSKELINFDQNNMKIKLIFI